MTGRDALVLWDIDHTLLAIEGAGPQLYAAAFRDVTGRELERMPPMGGRTDHHLITSVLTMHGIEPTAQLFHDFCTAMVAAVRTRLDDMRAVGRAMPGAEAALDALAGVPGLVQSLVTGNLRPIAEMKLALFGLDRHVDTEVGGYGSDDGNRAVLVRRALERAGAKYGHDVLPERTVVVGDTIHDIAGARDNAVAAVGIAWTDAAADALAAAGADAVLRSLTDTRVVVATVLGLLGAGSPSER